MNRKGKGKGRANILAGKPELPPFLKRLREQIVINETTIEDKSKKLRKADERDYEDRKDEAPTVVKLKDGDITGEEYKKLKEDAEKKLISEGKLKFYSKQHDARIDRSDTPGQSSSKTQRKEQELKEKLQAATVQSKKEETKTVNRMLLSFEDD